MEEHWEVAISLKKHLSMYQMLQSCIACFRFNKTLMIVKISLYAAQ